MKTVENFGSNEHAESSFSKEDIVAMVSSIRHAVDDFLDAHPHSSFSEGRVFEQQQCELLIKNLEHSRDRLRSIFQTSHGSYYFILETGESLRIKKDEHGYAIQPLMERIFFISQETFDAIREARSAGTLQFWLVGRELAAKNTPEIGLYPLELLMYRYSSTCVVRDTPTGFIIESRDVGGDQSEPQYSSGIHVGHPITSIE